MEHCGIYTWPLTVKLIIFEGRKSQVSRYFHHPTGTCCNNATLSHPAGNWTCDVANLVWWSANWATEAIAESMVTSSVIIMVIFNDILKISRHSRLSSKIIIQKNVCLMYLYRWSEKGVRSVWKTKGRYFQVQTEKIRLMWNYYTV